MRWLLDQQCFMDQNERQLGNQQVASRNENVEMNEWQYAKIEVTLILKVK